MDERCTTEAQKYGSLRLVRDIFGMSGFIEITEQGEIKGLILNKGPAIARSFNLAFQVLLGSHAITVELGSSK